MPIWTRSRSQFLIKSTKMTDGEVLHLLLGRSLNNDSEFDDKIYASLQGMRTATGRSALWLFGTGAFGILSHFGMLKSASSAGLEVSPAVFSHVALLALSFSTMIFCFYFCKQTFLQTWFSSKLKKATPGAKARLLLLYPDAYWHFMFMPEAIGYPPHIHGRRTGYGQIASLCFVLVGLCLASLGTFTLWFTVAYDVWASTGTSSAVIWMTLSLSAIAVLLGWTSPFYYDFPRKYTHYGLATGLANMDEVKAKYTRGKVLRAAARMGLIDSQ